HRDLPSFPTRRSTDLKRDGQELSTEEIKFVITGYTTGDIADYQMSAFLMAVYFQNMTERERADLTLAMAESGDQIDLSAIDGIRSEEHTSELQSRENL